MTWTPEELATMPDNGTRDWDLFMADQYARQLARAESEGDTFAADMWRQASAESKADAIMRR